MSLIKDLSKEKKQIDTQIKKITKSRLNDRTSDSWLSLRALKKKRQREGVFREMKLKQHFEKPSVRKAREKAEAIRRARKLARKKNQRDVY